VKGRSRVTSHSLAIRPTHRAAVGHPLPIRRILLPFWRHETKARVLRSNAAKVALPGLRMCSRGTIPAGRPGYTPQSLRHMLSTAVVQRTCTHMRWEQRSSTCCKRKHGLRGLLPPAYQRFIRTLRLTIEFEFELAATSHLHSLLLLSFASAVPYVLGQSSMWRCGLTSFLRGATVIEPR
jgi:hypothetical protein